jgi:hypothetical protein
MMTEIDFALTAFLSRSSAVDGLRMSGRLCRSPFAGSLYGAELMTIARREPREYSATTDFEREHDAPVLLSCSQHYRLLGELIGAARSHIAGLELMIVQMPASNFVTPLPPELLADDVFLVHDPKPLAARVKANDHSRILTIEDSLRRDSYEVGMNEVSLAIHDSNAIADFAAFLRATRLPRCLVGMTFQAIERTGSRGPEADDCHDD